MVENKAWTHTSIKLQAPVMTCLNKHKKENFVALVKIKLSP
jgi:hypothetical protein